MLTMNNKKICIVTYRLGVGNGVGGRRWSRYGRELIRKGYEVTFLTFEQGLAAELGSSQVIRLTSSYPDVLRSYPRTLVGKLSYRFYTRFLKKRVPGTIYDEAVRDEKILTSALRNVLQRQGGGAVIVSGAPFSLLYHTIALKKEFSGTRFICDLRDAWTWGTHYGFAGLDGDRMHFEREKEELVFHTSDRILCASEDLKKHIDRAVADPSKVSVLVNTVDCENMQVMDQKKKGGPVLFVHAGSVNKGTEKYWIAFLRALAGARDRGAAPFMLRFIGCANPKVHEFAAKYGFSFVDFVAYKPEEQLKKELNEADFLCFFKHDDFPHSFPTKFLDYICARRPVLAFTARGQVSTEIENNRLGFVFNDSITTHDILGLLEQAKNGDLVFNNSYDPSRFTTAGNVGVIEAALA
jgi:glycosyltransferase involved in cell wall biosynthesis